jgi:hypothetical protein
MDNRVKLATLLLRLGLAAVFGYAAIASLVSPDDWIGYLPHFATALVPGVLLLKLFSAYELVLALWLLWGRYMRAAGIVSAMTILAIVGSDIKLFAITFRDLPIAAGAVALALLSD